MAQVGSKTECPTLMLLIGENGNGFFAVTLGLPGRGNEFSQNNWAIQK